PQIIFRADETVWDGRFANNGWLQELPKSLTKIVWENAALISPATAEALSLANGDVVELTAAGRTVTAPVFLLPGHAAGVITLSPGYGRTRAGKVGSGLGYSAYEVRTSDRLWQRSDVELRKLGRRHDVVNTQHHWSMDGRDIVRETTFAEALR